MTYLTPAAADQAAAAAFERWTASGDPNDAIAYRRAAREASLVHDEFVAQARSLGTCTVCEREGYQPWQLDGSGRCEDCRP